MITAIIHLVIRFRWIVGGLVAVLIALSVYAVRTVALDAIPDISDPQIIVYAKWPRSPQVIETEVTEPIIRALSGSPDIQSVRGTSHMGYSFIYVILQDPGRRAAVRQFVTDRLAAIHAALNEGHSGDTILLAGKGHVAYQVIGTEKLPFDEREIVQRAVRGER